MKVKLKKKEIAYLAALLSHSTGGGYALFEYLHSLTFAEDTDEDSDLYSKYAHQTRYIDFEVPHEIN